jgi:DNA-binding MarR family transcriptional regulator
MTALTEEGFLTRKEDPENRRKHILALTPKGEKAITEAKRVLEQALDELFQDVSMSDRKLISATFDRITTKLLDINQS